SLRRCSGRGGLRPLSAPARSMRVVRSEAGADLVHRGAANGTLALNGGLAVLHRHLLRLRNLALGAALDAVCFHERPPRLLCGRAAGGLLARAALPDTVLPLGGCRYPR